MDMYEKSRITHRMWQYVSQQNRLKKVFKVKENYIKQSLLRVVIAKKNYRKNLMLYHGKTRIIWGIVFFLLRKLRFF